MPKAGDPIQVGDTMWFPAFADDEGNTFAFLLAAATAEEAADGMARIAKAGMLPEDYKPADPVAGLMTDQGPMLHHVPTKIDDIVLVAGPMMAELCSCRKH